MKKLAMCALLLAHCGQGSPSIQSTARVSALAPLTLEEIKSVELFLVEGHTRAGDPLSCDALGDDTPLSRDDLIARDHRLTPLADVTIPDIVATGDLILLADGYATETASGNRIAHGCADAIKVNARQQTEVALLLHAVP